MAAGTGVLFAKWMKTLIEKSFLENKNVKEKIDLNAMLLHLNNNDIIYTGKSAATLCGSSAASSLRLASDVEFLYPIHVVPYASANNCGCFCEGMLEADVDWNSLRIADLEKSALYKESCERNKISTPTTSVAKSPMYSSMSVSCRNVLSTLCYNNNNSPGNNKILTKRPSPLRELLTEKDCKQKLWHFLVAQDLGTMVDTAVQKKCCDPTSSTSTSEGGGPLLHRVHCVSFKDDGFVSPSYGTNLFQALKKLVHTDITDSDRTRPTTSNVEQNINCTIEWKPGGHIWAFLRKNTLQKNAIVHALTTSKNI